MTVTFHGAMLERAGGEKSFKARDSRSIRELVDELGSHFGEGFKELLLSGETCFFLVNGKGIMSTGGLDTLLHPEDKVDILPLIVAG
jgi:molybdopterin converting factor small subunit